MTGCDKGQGEKMEWGDKLIDDEVYKISEAEVTHQESKALPSPKFHISSLFLTWLGAMATNAVAPSDNRSDQKVSQYLKAKLVKLAKFSDSGPCITSRWAVRWLIRQLRLTCLIEENSFSTIVQAVQSTFDVMMSRRGSAEAGDPADLKVLSINPVILSILPLSLLLWRDIMHTNVACIMNNLEK